MDAKSLMKGKNIDNILVKSYDCSDKRLYKILTNQDSCSNRKRKHIDLQKRRNFDEALNDVNQSLVLVNCTLQNIAAKLEEIIFKYSNQIFTGNANPSKEKQEDLKNDLPARNITDLKQIKIGDYAMSIHKKVFEKICSKLKMDNFALSGCLDAEAVKELLQVKRMEYKINLMEACIHSYEHLLNKNVLNYCSHSD